MSGKTSATGRRPSVFSGMSRSALPERLQLDREDMAHGLAQLVLTVLELLRQVLERQAVHRMEGGTLSDDEVERLGLAFLRLRDTMDELKRTFGLEDADLDLDLGPLSRLL